MLLSGHLVHYVEQHLLDDRAQGARAGPRLHSPLHDGVESVGGKLQLHMIQGEQLLVLLDHGVARLGEDA